MNLASRIPRAKRRAWLLKHHRTDIDPYGRVLRYTGKDLWHRLSNARKRYIIDTHTDWERYLGRREYFEDVFILGTTRLNEQPDLLRLFEDPQGRKKIGKNFVLFRFEGGEGSIQRLDEFVLSTYDRKKLKETGFYTPETREIVNEEHLMEDEIRCQLLSVLRRGKAEGKWCEVSLNDQALYASIKSRRAGCFSNLPLSAEVARTSFALLLINSLKARSNYLKKGSINGFHDAALIGNALFFNAEVLSNDAGVQEMGHYCGVTVRSDLKPNAYRGRSRVT